VSPDLGKPYTRTCWKYSSVGMDSNKSVLSTSHASQGNPKTVPQLPS
jgi:hypothetical protein